jgi:hypothetical protein
LEELNEPSPEPILERLKAMPKGISGLYELALHRLGSKGSVQESQMRRKLLTWVTLAVRPVTVSEMQYACAVLDGQKSFDSYKVVLPTTEQMIACCGHLLEVYNEDQLRFTHRTVKEFLLQPLDGLSEISRNDENVTSYMVNEAEGHTWMATTCGKTVLRCRNGRTELISSYSSLLKRSEGVGDLII